MTKFYEFLPKHIVEQFEERYKTMKHRYRSDEKAINIMGLEKFMYKANSYTSIDPSIKLFHQSYYKYQTDSIISYLEEWDEYIVLLIWQSYSEAKYHHLIRVNFIHKLTDDNYAYSLDNFRGVTLLRNADDVSYGNYYVNGYTLFYSYSQRKLDINSLNILKNMEKFKYLPLDKFEKYNLYLLLQYSDEMLNHYEILIKSGAYKLATKLMLQREKLSKEKYNKIKKLLSKNKSYDYYQRIINPPIIYKSNNIRNNYYLDQLNTIHTLHQNNIPILYQNDILMKNMKKIIIEYEDYIFTNPTSLDELKYESEKLNHCLGKSMILKYSSDIVEKKSTILFLRTKEDPKQPFFTIELKDNKLIQCRSINNSTDKKITELVQTFISNRTILNSL